ncbi:hypothetical protein CYFUS_004927 [Cystobacter fuscus]|uniref:DUF4390 domain-containing protein n=1 Tax=Cystobacter fuscus TaxID=43 RepID=A0A250J7A1_9BACT|nr:DUF4390 domain-containing protein [Cystobacter fuscus]ATB39483.1 hypothetical protein CYFUS_004927 [Cystobacter fuscus]
MNTRGSRKNTVGKGLFGVGLAVVGLLATSAGAEEAPRVDCVATRAGRRVVARSEALGLVAPELERLMRLGLAGRLEVELTLLRHRPWWFAERVETARLTLVLAYSAREQHWALDGRALAGGPGVLELERVAWTLTEEPAGESPWSVEVSVRLQVVTPASLGRMARWLTQGEQTEEERSALTRGLLLSLAEDLTRGAQGRCTVTVP